MSLKKQASEAISLLNLYEIEGDSIERIISVVQSNQKYFGVRVGGSALEAAANKLEQLAAESTRRCGNTQRLCCCIPDQTKLNERCQNAAEYQIWMGDNPSPDDFTESCGKHLEQMLDASTRFEVFRIPNKESRVISVEGIAPKLIKNCNGKNHVWVRFGENIPNESPPADDCRRKCGKVCWGQMSNKPRIEQEPTDESKSQKRYSER